MAARREYPDAAVFETIAEALDELESDDGNDKVNSRRVWKSDGCYILAGTIGQATDAIVSHKELKPAVLTQAALMKALRDELSAK